MNIVEFPKAQLPTAETISEAHGAFCKLTGQSLWLGFDRERGWYDLLRAGYGMKEIREVVIYLQGQIRDGKRNVGSLKLSNFLQLDRFEEDLNISRMKIKPKIKEEPMPEYLEKKASVSQKALQHLRDFKRSL